MTAGIGTPPAPAEADERFPSALARQLRADSIRCGTAAGSGHPTSAMSAADLMAVPLARHLPGSGTPDELMEAAGISASRIAAARELVRD